MIKSRMIKVCDEDEGKCRYGCNRKENDNDVKGEGNQIGLWHESI